MGAATSWWLAREGHQVTLLEQFEQGHKNGSSHGCSRIFRLAYTEPGYARFARSALGLWRLLEDEAQTGLLHITGGVDHGVRQATQQVARALEEAGVAVTEMRPAEAAERWTGLEFDNTVIFQPDAGRLAAAAAVRAMQDEAVRHGATVRFGARVLEVRGSGERAEVVLADGVLRADVVVLSMGCWLPGMLAKLTAQWPRLGHLPVFRVTQEQPAYFPVVRESSEWPVFLHHRSVTSGANNSGFGYYGLLTPERGIKVGEHATGPEVDPASPRPGPSAAALARTEDYVARWLPGAAPAAAAVDTCLYTSTPDGEFVLRRDGPVVVCSPCSGHGFKFAPAIGRLTAALATGEMAAVDAATRPVPDLFW